MMNWLYRETSHWHRDAILVLFVIRIARSIHINHFNLIFFEIKCLKRVICRNVVASQSKDPELKLPQSPEFQFRYEIDFSRSTVHHI